MMFIFISASIFKNCKQNDNVIQKQENEYSEEQKNEFNEIISTVIIPEQNQFPPLLTFKTPKKLYVTKKSNLFTDSIDIEYIKITDLFKNSTLDDIKDQNNYKLEDFNNILKNINLTNIDSTRGTITKVIYIPIINSKKDNAFLRIKTLDSGHFLDTRDYWLQKENYKWKIVKDEMIMVH